HRCIDRADVVDRRVQPDMVAAYAVDQNAAGRPGRQLRLDAIGNRVGLYLGISVDADPASGGPAMAGRSRRSRSPKTFYPDFVIMTDPVAITLSGCAKTWPDGTRALHPIDLHVQGGETLALLGPSGCGKTTLLRLMCGLEQADAGASIRFGNEDVTSLSPEDRGVGVVFQSYALFPN